jgi:DNA polymerase I-like protein with 3'-5' exonuclease and polymerase domains
LYELKGAAYSLIENKIKSILKNADKVGISIDKSEFNKLRDESNHRMFEITRKEVEMIGVRLSEMDLPQLVIRHREMQKLLSRLKEESNMQDDLPGDDRLSVMTIVETA